MVSRSNLRMKIPSVATFLPAGLLLRDLLRTIRTDIVFDPNLNRLPIVMIAQDVYGPYIHSLIIENPICAVPQLKLAIKRRGINWKEIFSWLVAVRLAQRCANESNALGTILESLYIALEQCSSDVLLAKGEKEKDPILRALFEEYSRDYLVQIDRLTEHPRLWPPCRTKVLPGWREMMQHFLDLGESLCIRNPGECVLMPG